MNDVTTATPKPTTPTRASPPPCSPEQVKMATKNLDFYYGKNKTLHGVNLQVLEKGVTAMIGPSGCGKSTLLRVLNRIYASIPASGRRGR